MYELGHLGLYKNIPKKRKFNSTPDYERDSYTLLQYKSHLRNEFLIPLSSYGDGTGVLTLRLMSTEAQSVSITGVGRFYSDAGGTLGESTTATVGTSLTTLYVKVSTGSCYIVVSKADKLSGLGSDSLNLVTETSNSPFIDGCNIGYPLLSLLFIRLNVNSRSFLTGSIDNTPNLTYLSLYNNPITALTGSIDNTPNLTYLNLYNNLITALTGSIDNTPNLNILSLSSNPLTALTGSIDNTPNLTYLNLYNNPITALTGSIDNTPNLNVLSLYNNPITALTGSIDNTPNLNVLSLSSNPLTALTGSIDNTPNLTHLNLYNNPITALTGDIGKLLLCNYFNFAGNTASQLTYQTTRTNWTSSFGLINVSMTSMTSAMVDNLFIDIDNSGVLPVTEKLINVNGLCGAVTSASAAARASLVSKGFTVIVNI